ncbi:hypothetical protein GCM10027037_05740 [Mucilaginibacter koreensis]
MQKQLMQTEVKSIDQLKSTYSTEQVLIILLSRLYFGIQQANHIHAYLKCTTVNWPAFYRIVCINNIRGFIYDVVINHHVQIDSLIFNQLKIDARVITQKSFYQFKLTRQLLNDFKSLSITVIPYKGSMLANNYYKNPFLRESSDIDFLVKVDDVCRIRSYLKQNGYKPKFDAADKYLPYLIENYKELSFTPPLHTSGLNCSVEIQWRLLESYFGNFPDYNFFAKALRWQTEPDEIGLTETYDFICTASHHLIKEPLWKFKYLIDLACMIQTAGNRYTWDVITGIFKTYGYEKFLYSGLTALSEILGINFSCKTYSPTLYQLFLIEKYPQNYNRSYLQLLKVINSHQTFSQSLNFNTKALLSIFKPNLNDLKLNLPAWAVPLLVLTKPFRILYEQSNADRKND